MRTKNSQLLLALLALLTMVFSIGFFIGRQSIPYEVAAQTEHAVKQTDEFPAQEETDKPDAAADTAAQDEPEAEEAAQPEITYPLDLNRATLEELMTAHRRKTGAADSGLPRAVWALFRAGADDGCRGHRGGDV